MHNSSGASCDHRYLCAPRQYHKHYMYIDLVCRDTLTPCEGDLWYCSLVVWGCAHRVRCRLMGLLRWVGGLVVVVCVIVVFGVVEELMAKDCLVDGEQAG